MRRAPRSTPLSVALPLLCTGAVALSLLSAPGSPDEPAPAARPAAAPEVRTVATLAEDPMLIGASAKPHAGRTSIAAEVAFLERKVGRLEIRRVYDTGFDRNFLNRARLDVGKRATHYSFKPDMAELAAGRLDGAVRQFLRTIPRGHRTILTVWHEPENNFTTAASKSTYRAGWRRFARLVKATNRRELSTSWVMMSYSWRAMSGRQPLHWWPGDGVVNSVGIDTYNEGSLSGTRWDSPGRAFGQPFRGEKGYAGGLVDGGPLAFVKRHKTRIGIAEFGSLENTRKVRATWTGTATKAEWLRQAIPYYKRIGAVYVEYFHSGPYRGPWWLDSSTGSLAAYRTAVTRH